MASASSEHGAGEAPEKKPWSRPTFYVLTDVIESHGAPNLKSHHPFGTLVQEDETIPTGPGGNTRFKNYRPATA